MLKMNGWEYGQDNESLNNLLHQLSAFLTITDDPEWFQIFGGEAYLYGGGKAFGLYLLNELLVKKYDPHLYPQRNGVTIPHVFVPPFCGLDHPLQQFLMDEDAYGQLSEVGKIVFHPGKLVVRSSEEGEDWIDDASGTNRSVCCYGLGVPESLAHHMTSLQDVVRDLGFAEKQNTLVAQHMVNGIGMVIDIAYSELYQQDIVRIAAGKHTGNGYTSATWDQEGSIHLYDPIKHQWLMHQTQRHSGTELLECSGRCSHVGDGVSHSERAARTKQLAMFADGLYQAVIKSGITFGVQLEAVTDGQSLDKIALVQLRPTPEKMRHTLDFSLPKKKWEGLYVNIPYVIEPSRVIQIETRVHRRDAIVRVAEEYGRQYADCRSDNMPIPEHCIPEEKWHDLVNGKVVLFESLLPKYAWSELLLGLVLLGASGIVGRNMGTNSSHGTPGGESMARDLRAHTDLIDELCCPTIGLGYEQISALCRAHHENKELKIVMQSDGLIGFVSIQ